MVHRRDFVADVYPGYCARILLHITKRGIKTHGVKVCMYGVRLVIGIMGDGGKYW